MCKRAIWECFLWNVFNKWYIKHIYVSDLDSTSNSLWAKPSIFLAYASFGIKLDVLSQPSYQEQHRSFDKIRTKKITSFPYPPFLWRVSFLLQWLFKSLILNLEKDFFFFITTNKIISLSENASRMQNILVCFSSTLEHRLNKWSTIHPNRIDVQCLKAVCYN